LTIVVPKGKSVNSKFYKGVVLKKLRKYINKQWPVTDIFDVRLLHGNVLCNIVGIVRELSKAGKSD
jgi:hypothetical protein